MSSDRPRIQLCGIHRNVTFDLCDRGQRVYQFRHARISRVFLMGYVRLSEQSLIKRARAQTSDDLNKSPKTNHSEIMASHQETSKLSMLEVLGSFYNQSIFE